jgi:RNA polymerase-binding transcription factor DksA
MTSRYLTQPPIALTATDESEFSAALHEQRRFRVDQLAQLIDDEATGGNAFGSIEVTAALKRAAAHALTEIELALARLAGGSYGRCTGCREHISRERLEVLPAAALCMACQRGADAGRPPAP